MTGASQFRLHGLEKSDNRPSKQHPSHPGPGSLFLFLSMILATALSGGGCPREIGPVIIGDGNTQQEVNAR